MLNYLVAFGGLLAILISLAQVVHPSRQQRWLPAALFLLLGLVHLSTALQFAGYFDSHPQQHGYQVPLYALIGPCMYFYFQSQFDPAFATAKRLAAHALPVIVFTLMMVPYLVMSGEEKLATQTTAFDLEASIALTYPINVVLLIFASAVMYLLVPLVTFFDLWRKRLLELGTGLIIVVAFLVSLILSMLVLIYYQFVPVSWMQEAHALFVSAWITAVFLVGQRYPRLLQPVAEEIRKARYQKSQIDHLDVDTVVQALAALMQQQRLWADAELSLASLAAQLEVTPHQLSQILNQTLGCNFRAYIKRYRIEEAKARLLDQPDRKILAIALDVGFKSISSFNGAFQKETGMTPSEFRDSELKKPLLTN